MSSFVLPFVGVLFNIVSGEYECREANTWIELPSLPNKVGEVASTVINDDLYLAGAINEETYKYSFIDHTWSQVSDRIYRGNHQGSFTLNNEWWLVGGIDDNSHGKVQIFNPNTNTWRENPSLPWDSGSLCVALINEMIYACGGIIGFHGKRRNRRKGTETSNLCAKYNTKSGALGQWETIAPMPFGRNHAATTIDNKKQIWIFGGRIGQNVLTDGFDTVQVYDSVTDEWKTNTAIASMPFPRGGLGNAIFYKDHIYIFGGETQNNPQGYANSNGTYNVVNIYDIMDNEWSEGTSMIYSRHGIFPVLYKNAVYVAGGGIRAGCYPIKKFTKYCLAVDDIINDMDDMIYNSSNSIGFYGHDIAFIIGVFVIITVLTYLWFKIRDRNRKKLKLGGDLESESQIIPLMTRMV